MLRLQRFGIVLIMAMGLALMAPTCPGDDCADGETTFDVGDETVTLCIMAGWGGWQLGTQDLYGAQWVDDSVDTQLIINGLPADVAPGTYTNDDWTDFTEFSLLWEGNIYFADTFSIVVDEWGGDGGVGTGTFTATVFNGELNETLEVTGGSFEATISDS